MEKDIEYFKKEYERLFKWRELWTRLAERRPKSFRAKLQTRNEAVQLRAQKANMKILRLMKEYDEWKLKNPAAK